MQGGGGKLNRGGEFHINFVDSMDNSLLDCTQGSYTSKAGAAQFDDARPPFHSRFEYKQEMRNECGDYSDDALLTSELTLQSTSNGKTKEKNENDKE